MTELMNLEMVLPAPLNPPFPERHAMDALGRVHFIGIGGAGMSAIAAAGRRDRERFGPRGIFGR